MQPVGAAAVVQIAGINKSTYTQDYQSAISLLVIDFTFLEGRDGEIVVNCRLATVDSHSNRDSSCVFKRSYSWKYLRLTPKPTRLLTTGAIGMMATCYIQS